MSIRHHKDKHGNIVENAWVIDYYPSGEKGKRVQRTIFDCSETKARQIEMALRRRRNGGIRNEVNPLLRDVIPEWLEWLRLHRSPKTYDSISWALKHLLPHFGHLTVNQIDEITFDRYKSKRKSTPRGCNLEMDYLKSLISWMVDRKMCDPLPFKVERLPYKKSLPKVPTPEGLRKWMGAVDRDGPWDAKKKIHLPGPKNALIWMMALAGLRYTEAVTLEWSDLDFDRGVIHVRNAKGGRERIAILPEESRQILEPIYKHLQEEDVATGLIAPNPKTGKHYASMKTMFKTASEKSGVNIKGPHTLRHFCGTYTLAATGDLRLVQTTLGHTQVRTTEIYTQINVEQLRDAQSKLTRLTSEPKKRKKV